VDALPPSNAGDIQDLIRRIEILERSNKALSTAVQGGQIRVLAADGTPIVALGRLSSTTDGIRIYTADGLNTIMRVDNEDGVILPWAETYWRPYETSSVTHTVYYGEVTGSTFRRMWRTTQELVSTKELRFRIIVTTPVGTEGEIRVWHNNASAVLGGVLSVPDGTTAQVFEFRLAHGITINTSEHNLYIEGRVTSGPDALRIYIPGGMFWGSLMSTVAGGWVP
jgi:hypothetical protein